MINGNGFRIVSALGIVGLGGLGTAVIEPHSSGFPRLDVRHLHPHVGFVEQRVDLLKVMLQHRLLVVSDEADVTAVLLGIGEIKVTVMQTHEHRAGADGIADGEPFVAGVDRDLLAHAPLRIPPCSLFLGGRDDAADEEDRGEKKRKSFCE